MDRRGRGQEVIQIRPSDVMFSAAEALSKGAQATGYIITTSARGEGVG